MFKKMIAIFALFGALATSAVADESSANVSNDNESTFAISLHPTTMIIYSLVLDMPSIFLTMENAINSNLSVITRPYYVGYEDSNDYETLDIDMFGWSEGVRFYFNRGHRGLFTAFHVFYNYVSLDYEYAGSSRYYDEKANGKGNAVGVAFYIGSKSVWGHLTTSWDIGVTYANNFVKAQSKDDVDEVSKSGISYDLNYTIGFNL